MRFSFIVTFALLYFTSTAQHTGIVHFKPHFIFKSEAGYTWEPGQFFKNGTSIQDRQKQQLQYSLGLSQTIGYQFNRIANVNVKAFHVTSRKSSLSGLSEPDMPGSDSLLLDNEISATALLLNLDASIPFRHLPWLHLHFEGGAGAAFFRNFDNSIDLRRNLPYSFIPQSGWNLAGYLNFYASFKLSRGIFVLAGFDALGFEDSPHERMRVYTGVKFDFSKKQI